MGAKSSWWQKIKRPLSIITVLILVITLFVVVVLGYRLNWPWVGVSGGNSKITTITTATAQPPAKTLWDWLSLLGVPVVVGFGAVWFTARFNHDIQIAREQHLNDRRLAEQQHDNEQHLTLDNQREARLQAYIDKMSELLLEKKLRDSAKADEVRKIAHVRTLAVLSTLDGQRKGTILQFLHESNLINEDNPFIFLYGVDLSSVNLSGAFRKAFPWEVEPGGFEPWGGRDSRPVWSRFGQSPPERRYSE